MKQAIFTTEAQLIEFGMRHKRLIIDRSIFKKTKAEKILLKDVRKAHNYLLRSNGIDSKKQMNTSDSLFIKS